MKPLVSKSTAFPLNATDADPLFNGDMNTVTVFSFNTPKSPFSYQLAEYSELSKAVTVAIAVTNDSTLSVLEEKQIKYCSFYCCISYYN